MIRRVFRWSFIFITILFVVFVISLAVTFFQATGALSAADAAFGTNDVSHIAASANDAAITTQNFLFRLGEHVPFVGGVFTGVREQAQALQEKAAEFGAGVGNAVAGVGQQFENLSATVGDLVSGSGE